MPNLPHLENPRHLLPISSVVPPPGPMDTVSHVLLFASPWTIACQAPLSMEFFRPGYWSGLTFSSLGDLPDPEIKPASLVFPTLASEFLSTTREDSRSQSWDPTLHTVPSQAVSSPQRVPLHPPPAWIQCPFHRSSLFYVLITSTYVFPDTSYILTHLNWDQDCREKYQQPRICRWYHTNGRKQRGTKEPLDEGEKGV